MKRYILIVIGIALLVFIGFLLFNSRVTAPSANSTVPQLKTTTVAEGLSKVWDVAQSPNKTLFYTERANKIGVVLPGQKPRTIYSAPDVVVGGEGGMLGMTLDPDFKQNRFLYACFNTSTDVRVARFTVAKDASSLLNRVDIVTDMPVNPSGRHSGCRPRFSPDKTLWIGTGDTARSEPPQSPDSLGGKILRIDRDGKPATGNLGEPYDPRIFSYGHRNTQGLAFYSQPRSGLVGYSVEHGPDRDDEVNPLVIGNFGWDPGPGYDESVDMTDLQKFPNAVKPVWKSGKPTIAPSGATFLVGAQWKSWQNNLLVAVQKDKHVRMFTFDASGKKVVSEKRLLDTFGRIRTVENGIDGSIYMTTDNGDGTDRIIQVSAQ